MTSKLPLISSEELAAALRSGGFEALRKSKGSHLMMVRPNATGGHDHVVVVLGQRQVPLGTLRGILRQGNISEEEFLNWLPAKKRRRRASPFGK